MQSTAATEPALNDLTDEAGFSFRRRAEREVLHSDRRRHERELIHQREQSLSTW